MCCEPYPNHPGRYWCMLSVDHVKERGTKHRTTWVDTGMNARMVARWGDGEDHVPFDPQERPIAIVDLGSMNKRDMGVVDRWVIEGRARLRGVA